MNPVHFILPLLGMAVAATMKLSAYAARELVGSVESPTQQKRCFSTHTMPKTYAAGTGTLQPLTPMAINSTTKKWVVWSKAGGGTQQISTVTINATGGTFTMTINGQTTAAIAWNALAATVQTAVDGLDNIIPGDIVVSGGVGGTAPYSITTAANRRLSGTTFTITTAAGSLTGGAGTAAVATPTAAVAATGTNAVKGFSWPDVIVLDVANDVLGQTCLGGDIHFDDIVLPSGEILSDLQAACRTLRPLGFRIQGLAQVE